MRGQNVTWLCYWNCYELGHFVLCTSSLKYISDYIVPTKVYRKHHCRYRGQQRWSVITTSIVSGRSEGSHEERKVWGRNVRYGFVIETIKKWRFVYCVCVYNNSTMFVKNADFRFCRYKWGDACYGNLNIRTCMINDSILFVVCSSAVQHKLKWSTRLVKKMV